MIGSWYQPTILCEIAGRQKVYITVKQKSMMFVFQSAYPFDVSKDILHDFTGPGLKLCILQYLQNNMLVYVRVPFCIFFFHICPIIPVHVHQFMAVWLNLWIIKVIIMCLVFWCTDMKYYNIHAARNTN